MADDGVTHSYDLAQIRLMADQMAEASLDKFVKLHPELTAKPEIPAPLKWAGAILAALMTAAVIGLAYWLVGTLNDLQLTVARIDERQQAQIDDASEQFQSFDRRITWLESQHGRAGR